MKADLYVIFGGYAGYMDAPLEEVVKQQLVWIARHKVEAEQYAKQEAKMAEMEREAQRAGRR